MVTDQVDKANKLNGFFCNFPIFFCNKLQILHATISNRNNQDAGICQLFKKWQGNLWAACGYNYCIVGPIFRPAVCTIIQLGKDIKIMQGIKNLSGLHQKSINPLNRIDLLTDL